MLYNKLLRMIFGVVCFIFSAFARSELQPFANSITLLGGYFFIYFSIFSLIDLSVQNMSSFHLKRNKSGVQKNPVKYFIENNQGIASAYKIIFNVGYAIISLLVIKAEGL